MRRIFSHIVVFLLTLGLLGYSASPMPVQAVTGITVSPSSGKPGTTVTVHGIDFHTNEINIRVNYDGVQQVAGVTADSSGVWNASFTIPSSVTGSHTIHAYGDNTTLGVNVNFNVTPGIALSLSSGVPGASITITGGGFAANESGVTVTFDSTIMRTGISVDSTGSWTTTFTVPASSSGSHDIDAYGISTAASNVPTLSFVVTTGISINPTSGPPGTSVAIVGSGFESAETGITVTYDGTRIVSGITANSQGGWNSTFTIPAASAGTRTIDAYGTITSASTVTDKTFTVTPDITISRMSGAPGSSITVTGVGFAASETGITVTYDGSPIVRDITANSQGGWTSSFTIPASASGSHMVSAYGSTTLPSTVSNITLVVGAGLTLNQTTGSIGSSVTITGSGFSNGETGITITYDATPVALGVLANSQGGWTTTFTVPPSVAGSHIIRAFGSITQQSSAIEASFSVTPSTVINPASGYVGLSVEITGDGFARNSTLRFIFDDKEILTSGAITDTTGSFIESITIPKATGGAHTLKVMDGQRNQSQSSFVMENTPPPAPGPLSPEDGSTVGILGGAKPTLRWSSVTDPSGVTYHIQIDTSSDFSQPILDKTDISGTRYTLTTADALPHGEYYWRVRAVDGASNLSEWSQPWLLKSGFLTLPVLIAIIGVVVVILGVLVYLLIARAQRRRWETVQFPEVEVSPVIPRKWQIAGPEETRERPMPLRLALPQASKRGKTLSTEEQARLKVIVDFVQSLPLVEAGYTPNWVVDLVETSMGIEINASVYEQLLKGELQVTYEPAWLNHPVYQELMALLEKQPVLQELNGFIDAVNHCGGEAVSLLQDIYRDTMAEGPVDFMTRGGWGFISAVYTDAMSWFLGRSLREPSERDYTIKPSDNPDAEPETFLLSGEGSTSFAGPLIQAAGEKEAVQLRALHLRLRRSYRNNDKARQLVSTMTQLDVQRNRLVNTFSQFSRLTQ